MGNPTTQVLLGWTSSSIEREWDGFKRGVRDGMEWGGEGFWATCDAEALAPPPSSQVALSQANGCPMTLSDFGVKAQAESKSLVSQWIQNPGVVQMSLKDLRPKSPPPVMLSNGAKQARASAAKVKDAAKARNAVSSIF